MVVEGTTGCSGGLLAAIDQIGSVGKNVLVCGLGSVWLATATLSPGKFNFVGPSWLGRQN